MLNDIIPSIIAELITENADVLCEDKKYHAAVAIVKCNNKWLLGLSTSNDDRGSKWCFPGGSIKGSETPQEGAEREAREETNVRCDAISGILKDSKAGVAFVVCKASNLRGLKPNSEFSNLGWFTEDEFKSLKLYNNVTRLIAKAKRYK